MKQLQRIPAELLPEEALPRRVRENERVAMEGMRAFFADGSSLDRLMEELEQETNWRRIRAALAAIDAYAEYLNTDALLFILDRVIKMLGHQNGAVRRRAARVGGRLLERAGRTETGIWKQYLHKMLFPGKQLPEEQQRHIGYAMQFVFQSLLEAADDTRRREILSVYAAYFKSVRWDTVTCLSLLGGIVNIPYTIWSSQQQNLILQFLRTHLQGDDPEMQLACRWVMRKWTDQGWEIPEDFAVLRMEAAEDDTDASSGNLADGFFSVQGAKQQEIAARMLVENQLSGTPWIRKLMNLQALKDASSVAPYLCAGHLISLLRFSNHAVVRVQAGRDLIETFPMLQEWQRQTLMQELFEAVSRIGEDASNEIPSVIGGIFLSATEDEQEAYLQTLQQLSESTQTDAVNAAMEIAGVILQGNSASESVESGQADLAENKQQLWQEGEEKPEETGESGQDEITQVLSGILCRGMTHYRQEIAREAFFLTDYYLFADQSVPPKDKQMYFRLFGRRILVYCGGDRTIDDTLYRAGAWKQLADCLDALESGKTGELPGDPCGQRQDMVVFSGTFDPFTCGHRAAVEAAMDHNVINFTKPAF